MKKELRSKKRVSRRKSPSNLLVKVVVRKSFIKLSFKETDGKPTDRPASYYVSLIYFGDVLHSSGVIAEAVIPADEKESFEREFFSELSKVANCLKNSLRRGYGTFKVSERVQGS